VTSDREFPTSRESRESDPAEMLGFPAARLLNFYGDMNNQTRLLGSVKSVVGSLVDNGESIARSGLRWQANLAGRVKGTPLAPVYAVQHRFAAEVVEVSANLIRYVCRLDEGRAQRELSPTFLKSPLPAAKRPSPGKTTS
jgi:hypothetical protein